MKKIACILISCLVLPLFACNAQSAASASEFMAPTSSTSELSESLSDSSNSGTSPSDSSQEVAPVWNTSDIDVSRIDTQRKLISFTFDDAPDATMKKLMSVFNSFNAENPDCPASATFFCNGIRMDDTTLHTLQEAYRSGFELGNHTQSHKNLTRLSPESIRKEIDSVDRQLEKIDGKEIHLLRVPYGCFNDKVRNAARTPLIDWEIDTEDWKGIPAQKIIDVILQDLRAGTIVLMHDGYPHTVEAVKYLLPYLKDKGYQIVNVSQLSKVLDRPLFAGKVYTRIRQVNR